MYSRRATKSTKKVRRPLTAYNFYFHYERQRLQAKLYSINGQRPTYTQISKLVGASWRKIKPEMKAHYEELAAKDKRRYAIDLVRAKEGENRDRNGPANGHSGPDSSDAAAVEAFNDSEVRQGSTMNFGKTRASPILGIDPSSLSYQAMLRQSLSNNNMSESDFLNTNNPHMLAQMLALSKMMIDYVKSVAPEKLANPPQGCQLGNFHSVCPLPQHEHS